MKSTYFQNKVIWITGASSGIGAEIARQLSVNNVKLILSARRIADLEKVKQICETNGSVVVLLPLDQSEPDNMTEIAKDAIKIYGKIDMFFNNAGISQRSYIVDTPLDVDKKVMDIDYFSGVALTKAVLPQMIKNGFGHVVATSSLSGTFGFPMRSAYCAAKHAMHGFFETIHAELAKDNIHVTIMAPGRIKTDLSKTAITKDGSAYRKMDDGQLNGMPVEKMVRKVLKAVRKQRIEIVVGGFEIITVYLRRYFPRIFFKIVTKIKPT